MQSRIASVLTAGLALVVVGCLPMLAQGGASTPENRFVLSGYGFTTYVDSDAPGAAESFNTGFVPIFLYRVSEKFLFEAELEFGFEGDVVETEVEYAQIDWLARDNVTVVVGKYLTPFGSFIEKQHPAWINKLPTAPLPYEHSQSLVPFSQTGIQLRGAVPMASGYGRLTYALFLSNGIEMSAHGHDEAAAPVEDAHSEEDEHSPDVQGEDEEGPEEGGHAEEEEAELIFLGGSSANANGETAFGGRVGVIPVLGLELGASYMSGAYDELGTLDATMRGFDVALHRELFDIRAEWLDSELERGVAEDGDPLQPQNVESWYFQPSLRLSVIPVYAFNKMELVARLANLDGGAGDRDQTSVGLNYYFTGSSVLRIAWERREETGHAAEDSINAMFALGF